MRIAIASLIVAGLIALPAAAATKPTRIPSERWVVNFADAQCVASRNYGTKENPLFLAVKEPPLGDILQVAIVRPGKGGKFAEQLNATITLDNGQSIRQSMIFSAVKETGNQLFSINMPRSLFETVAASKTMRVHAGYRLDETLELRALQPLFKVLDDCTANLRAVWHVDPEDRTIEERADARVPKRELRQRISGTLAGIISASDYPDIAIRGNMQGGVAMALLIDESGHVADCTVIHTSGIAALDAQSCSMVKQRAKFQPAVGLDGKPAKDATLARITWRIE